MASDEIYDFLTVFMKFQKTAPERIEAAGAI